MFLNVTSVTHLEDYKLRLTFNDGAVKDVDLRDELYGKVFEPLKDTELFKQVAVNSDTNTVEWPNGADFALAPEAKLRASERWVVAAHR
jgi:hypothetical protein